jgi:hypothetical protein
MSTDVAGLRARRIVRSPAGSGHEKALAGSQNVAILDVPCAEVRSDREQQGGDFYMDD